MAIHRRLLTKSDKSVKVDIHEWKDLFSSQATWLDFFVRFFVFDTWSIFIFLFMAEIVSFFFFKFLLSPAKKKYKIDHVSKTKNRPKKSLIVSLEN